MYQLVSATLKTREKAAMYESVDISQIQMKNLFATYLDGYITLTNPQLSGNQYVDLNALRASTLPLHPSLTFHAWLGSIGNLIIPAVLTQPIIATQHAVYSDAFRARYDIVRAHPTFALNVDVPLADKTDVVMTKTGVDPTVLFNNVLVSVNGLFHITDNYLGTHLRVKGGGKSCEIADRNNIALYSFKDVGEIQSVPITDPMITVSDIDVLYKQTVWINTGIDLTNKSVMVVLGGYLHACDNTYSVVNQELGVIQLNMDKIQLPQRYFESKKLIDLSSLEMTVNSSNPELISVAELYSNDVITRYLKLYQSYIVVVDTPTLYKQLHRLTPADLPGLYLNVSEPIYPLILRTGIAPEYWPRKEHDLWVLNVADNLSPNYRFESIPWEGEDFLAPVLEANQPNEYSTADLLEIGSQVRT